MGRSKFLMLAFAAWSAVAGLGVFALARYEATPGRKPELNRTASLIAANVASGKMQLVMFVHPKCPCSAASIEELSWLMTRYGDRLQTSVVMYQPDDPSDDVSQTEAWRHAGSISGVEVRPDINAVLAKQCGAQTSGQVFLYNEKGRLVFSGGITGSRGHVGDNDGLDTVVNLITSKSPPKGSPLSAPVFGCSIFSCTEIEKNATLPVAK